MTAWWFPDCTVLCNFAHVDRLDLLQAVLSARGRWTEAVAYEVTRSSAIYSELTSVSADGWLSAPIEFTEPKMQRRVEVVRNAMFGPVGGSLSHLGEAQTLCIIEEPEFAGSMWLSDDREALAYARRRGIPVLQTFDLLQQAVSDGECTETAAFELIIAMTQVRGNVEGRHLHRIPTRASEFR